MANDLRNMSLKALKVVFLLHTVCHNYKRIVHYFIAHRSFFITLMSLTGKDAMKVAELELEPCAPPREPWSTFTYSQKLDRLMEGWNKLRILLARSEKLHSR